ncbi:NAD(P)-binding protein [Acephala macrosclerotiorum]|nr:NAD(P)-binding protein [Acephala macrosclerotiorum]
MVQQQKYNKLADKHVLIIGGTSGIGYGVAEALIESFANITVSSSSPDRVKSAISSLQKSYPSTKTSIKGFACDLSKPTLEQDLEQLFEKTGKVDHIVFTAGDRLATIPLAESTLESIQRAGQVRFFAPLLVAKVGKKYLTGGAQSSIVLTTGSVADHPIPNWSVVASYAAGLHGMTRNLALDLKPIRVNLVSPGAIDTELWAHMSAEKKGEMFKGISAKVPTGKVGMPEDVAEAYLWLMKDSNVTGIVAYSDSGARLV